MSAYTRTPYARFSLGGKPPSGLIRFAGYGYPYAGAPYDYLALEPPAGAGQPETNFHFIKGQRFAPRQHTLLRGLYQNAATDFVTAPVVVDVATRFIAKHQPTTHKIAQGLRQNSDPNTPASFVPETNPHFLGRFNPTRYPRSIYLNSLDTGVPQKETNPHFLGHFTPTRHFIQSLLRQNSATDVPVLVQPPTETHWIGKYKATTHSVLMGLRMNADTVAPSAFVVETNPHTLGKFAAPKHIVLPALRQNAALDSQPETNPHQLGKFTAPQHTILRGLRENADNNPPPVIQPETNPHFVGQLRPGQHRLLTSLRQHGDAVSPSAFVIETNPPVIAKHRPTTHFLLPGLRQNVPSDIFVAPSDFNANPHFLGRFSPTTNSRLFMQFNTPAEGALTAEVIYSQTIIQTAWSSKTVVK